MTYQTPGVIPSVTVTQPVQGGTYIQNSATSANYTCTAVSAGDPNTISVGPYLSIPPATSPFAGVCAATDSVGGAVANGSQFDTGTVGPHTFTAQVQDSAMNGNQSVVNYTVVVPPAISGVSSATFAVGTANSVAFSATGYPTPTFTKSGALPSGVSFVDNQNGTATLAGTATVSGIYPMTITAQNGAGSPATLAFTLTVVASVPASGTKCNGVYRGTFNGNIVITAGQTCIFVGGGVTGSVTETGGSFALRNAVVGGNFLVSGGSFSIGPPATIKGNFTMQATPRSSLQNQLCGAAIGGNLTVLLNSSPVALGFGTSTCPGNTVAGNVTVSGNLASTAIFNNTVGGSLVDTGNLQPTQVFSNRIKGLLSCSANFAISGGGNSATKKTGQCATF
jgi:hypothetical protein